MAGRVNDFSGCLLARSAPHLPAALKAFPGALGVATAEVETHPVTPPPGTKALVLTSANAVPAVAHLSLPIIAVGEHTAEAAKAAGLTVALIGPGDGIQMAQSLVSTHSHFTHLCHVHGVTYRNNWYNICIQNGIQVSEITGYALHPAPKMPLEVETALRTGQVHTVILFSVQAGENLISMLSLANIDPSTLTAVAISGRVAAAAKAFGRVRTAAEPTRQSLQHAIQEHC